MSDTLNVTPESGDLRRAAAAVLNWSRGDQLGVQAVIQETTEQHRSLHLLVAMLGFIEELHPELSTEYGQEALSRDLMLLIQREEAERNE